MGRIRNSSKNKENIRFAGDTKSESNIIRFCQRCKVRGNKAILVIMPKNDEYLICIDCGYTELKQNAQVESDIIDVVEKNDDNKAYAISLDDTKLSNRGKHYNIIRWD